MDLGIESPLLNLVVLWCGGNTVIGVALWLGLFVGGKFVDSFPKVARIIASATRFWVGVAILVVAWIAFQVVRMIAPMWEPTHLPLWVIPLLCVAVGFSFPMIFMAFRERMYPIVDMDEPDTDRYKRYQSYIAKIGDEKWSTVETPAKYKKPPANKE